MIARSRGPDYIYSFLKSFYVDPSRPTGVNNLVLPGTSMPHVLWERQGLQEAVYDGESDAEHNAVHKRFKEFRQVQPGGLSPEGIRRVRARYCELPRLHRGTYAVGTA